MACLTCSKGPNDICNNAAKYGHLECLIRARKNGCPWDAETCAYAAKYEHLDCLIWAWRNGCPGNRETCGYAAMNGDLVCLIWARKNWSSRFARTPPEAVPWDKWTCAYAAMNGHLACLIWARKHGCPWDTWTCNTAAGNEHLDCLIWARRSQNANERCPWDKDTCSIATEKGHKDILKWIHANGSPCDCGKKVYIEWDGWKEDEDCAICLERLDESTVKFCGCVHRYHKECMDKMLEVRKAEKKKGCSICERGK